MTTTMTDDARQLLNDTSNGDNGTTSPSSVRLELIVSDPAVCRELLAREQGKRQEFANMALSIGVMCMLHANSRIDIDSLQNAGHSLIEQARETVAARGQEIVLQIQAILREHFDPNNGLMPTRIKAFLQKDGELERVLSSYIGSDDSALAQALAQYLGEHSPVYKLLSPDEQKGLTAHIRLLIETMLADQTKSILSQFSLDNKESALTRFLGELNDRHGALHKDIEGKIDNMRKDFSLDSADSALSRLVSRVELSQKKISDEFSSDNSESALNKLIDMLSKTNARIEQQLTLDDENSALSLMMRKLEGTQQNILTSHTELQAAFAALTVRKHEQSRSPKHGNAFEEDLSEVVAHESRRRGDVFQATGKLTGIIPHCKKGDYVIELGPDSPAAAARIVWEAKEDKSWDEKRALTELNEAIKNRQAQVGVFVFSTKTAPERMENFERYGNSIVIVWDSENPATDVVIRAAYSLARAMVIKQANKSHKDHNAINNIERATRAIEKQISGLEEIQKLAQTVKGHGDKIVDKSDRMRKELLLQIEKLDEQVNAIAVTEDDD
ncbi:hypothetical protein KF913_22675 [Candidatus Obscuribacterales bacterium]|nr:hypothetical protein [Candidatus Obscuribacterales bacterium]